MYIVATKVKALFYVAMCLASCLVVTIALKYINENIQSSCGTFHSLNLLLS